MASIFLILYAIKSLCLYNRMQECIHQVSEYVYHAWVDINSFIFKILLPTKWHIKAPENLDPKTWYMLICNHCSGIDILVLLSVFNRKIPHLKFFMKESLKWAPIVGQICYVLDYPMIKHYDTKNTNQNRDNRATNLNTIEQACKTLKKTPSTISIFVEGARYNPRKKKLPSNHSYKNLLAPKAGGAAMVLKQLDTEIHSLLDITLCYQKGATLVDFLCGNVPTIHVHTNLVTIDKTWRGDFYKDRQFRKTFCQKLQQLWQEKDQLLDTLHAEG